MPAQAVIFDVDGTLVDSVDLHARAWQEALAHFGHRVAFGEVRAQIGKGGDQLLPVFLSQDEISLRGKLVEDFRGDLYKREYLKRVRGFPGVRPLFKELLRRGLRIALASSAKGDELELYEQIAGIEGLLHAQTSKDDAEKSKPHPDIFEAALRRLGPELDRHRVFVVGDTPWDAIAARKMGVRTIGVLCGGFAETDLRAAGCVDIYRDPEDLHGRLEQSPLMA
jgi:phosphoglycolate phosphatase-like HAD superfamily hydrolase